MLKKVVASGLSLMMVLSSTGYQQLVQVHAETNMLSKQLSGIKSVEADKSEKNVVWVTFTNGYKGKLTFLDNGIFRYNVDPRVSLANMLHHVPALTKQEFSSIQMILININTR